MTDDTRHGITVENLLYAFPTALKEDPEMVSLATIVADELTKHLRNIDMTTIYARIDDLPEDMLDILAVDFKIDWWDSEYTVEEKRSVLKDNWRVHRMLGTKAAVETAISAIYPDTKVSEWFEYGGKPYHFKLLVDATFENVDREKHQRVLKRVEFYKNLRSVLDEVEYFANGTAESYVAVAFAGETITDGADAKNYEMEVALWRLGTA